MKQKTRVLVKVIFIMSLIITFSCSDDNSTKPANNVEIVPTLVLVEGGTFNNGRAEVTISDFFIGKYELTQAEYQAVIGSNPAKNFGGGDDYPVYYVTLYNAAEYCNARSILEGLTPCYDTSDWSCDFHANGYRSPTEAEWEYAARGGNRSNGYNYSGSNDIDEVAWYVDNCSRTTHPVGVKKANELRIHDMSGNVWEWCNDWYGNYSATPQTDPVGPTSGSLRVNRGGSWFSYASTCQVALRGHYNPSNGHQTRGFRVVRSSN